MGDRKYIVSLTRNGRVISDLTTLQISGEFTRLRNDVGPATIEITNDDSAYPAIRKLFCFATHIRCEEYDETCPNDRTNVMEGPIIAVTPSDTGVTISAGDMGAYWAKIPVNNSDYAEQDTAFLCEDFLRDNLAKNPNSMPEFNTFTSGYLDSIEISSDDRKFVADIMQGFPGLIYTFVCKNLFLFGEGTQSQSIIKFNDESWMAPPIPEQVGSMYANAITVIGDGVTGYAEQSNIDTAMGLLARRFDLPEIKSESVAIQAAKAYLRQTTNLSFLGGGQDLTLTPSFKVNTNDLIPGVYVDVNTYFTGQERSQRMLLDKVTIDLMTGDRIIGLQPLGDIDG